MENWKLNTLGSAPMRYSRSVLAAALLAASSLIAHAQAPTISSTNPSTVPMGENNRVTISGTNFVSGTQILLNGSIVKTSFISSTSVNAYLSAESQLAGSLVLTAQNPDGSTSANYAISLGAPSSTWATISTTATRTIPAGFLGLSHEWGDGEWVMGDNARGVNYAYRKLVSNLMDSPNSTFLIRMGGGSTDQDTTANSVQEFNELHAAIPGIKFTTGVILGNNINSTPGTAETIAQSYVNDMTAGSLDSIEIGNETDMYQYQSTRSYTFDVYNNKYSQWTSGILQTVAPATPKFTGPSWASMRTLLNDNYWSNYVAEPPGYLQLFLSTQSANTKTVTQHWYSGLNPPAYTASYLLGYAPSGSSGPLQYANPGVTPNYWAPSVLGWAAGLAHQDNLTYRVNESNSIDEGGQPGVSDSFAAALWAVDYAFELANAGVDGVNFHGANGGLRVVTPGQTCSYAWTDNKTYFPVPAPCTPSPSYAPFSFDIEHTNGGYPLTYTLDSVNPLYYGLYFFHLAVPDGAQLLPVTMQSPHNVKVWANKDSAGTIRIAVINKDTSWSGNVPITLPGFGSGQALVMSCANGYAGSIQYANNTTKVGTTGITISGQTFDGSTDGSIQGTQSPTTIPSYSNIYYVPVQPGTAVLLTLHP